MYMLVYTYIQNLRCICMHVFMHVCADVCSMWCVYSYMYICACLCVICDVCKQNLHCMHVRTYMYSVVRRCNVRLYMCDYWQTVVCAYVCMYVCTYVHMCVHTWSVMLLQCTYVSMYFSGTSKSRTLWEHHKFS